MVRRTTCRTHGTAFYVLPDGRYRCTTCETERQKRYYLSIRANPRKRRKWAIKRNCRKYGISVMEWAQLWVAQGGKCAICTRPFRSHMPHVDHNHITGAVRGLLCNPCNLAIGMLQESAVTVRAAAEYMERDGNLTRPQLP